MKTIYSIEHLFTFSLIVYSLHLTKLNQIVLETNQINKTEKNDFFLFGWA